MQVQQMRERLLSHNEETYWVRLNSNLFPQDWRYVVVGRCPKISETTSSATGWGTQETGISAGTGEEDWSGYYIYIIKINIKEISQGIGEPPFQCGSAKTARNRCLKNIGNSLKFLDFLHWKLIFTIFSCFVCSRSVLAALKSSTSCQEFSLQTCTGILPRCVLSL